jgi:sigma-B regulation protein RsbU (phosphoserine phosphatase)
MPNNNKEQENWWQRLRNYMRTHTSMAVIIAAAFLLELTTGLMYYTSQNIIQKTMVDLVQREMNAIYLCIRNQLAKVEVTVDNMAWVVRGDLAQPDSMFINAQMLVENNPAILGSTVTFIPNYYPEKGYWFEPYAVRRDDGTIDTMQLGSATHDYTKQEFFVVPIEKDSAHWCEPYLDSDGAKAMVTTYSVPVHDSKKKIVAVVDADISLDWLDEIMEESKAYKSTQRFLVTGSHHRLAGKESEMFNMALHELKSDKDKDMKGYVTLKDRYDEKWHIFFHPVGGKTDWILINVLKDSEVFGKLRMVRQLLILMALAGLVIIGFIVYRISRNLERLRKMNAEKDRIANELRIANDIQQSLLPKVLLKHDDVDVRGSLVPARQVGGDLFDYFLRDEKLFFCIGDVSGKGIPSAMLMACMHSMFRAFSAHDNDPAHIMHRVNEAACLGNDTNMFVTMFIGVLDLPTGRLRYCNAGHDRPIIINQDNATPLDAKANLPVGLFDDLRYEREECVLPPDCTLFLYTDGVTEAMNSKHQQFGLKRLMMPLSLVGDKLNAHQLLDAVTEAVKVFTGNAEQSDDQTMLAIHYVPQNDDSTLVDGIELKSDIKDVPRLNNFVKKVTDEINIDNSLTKKLRLAIEEAVVNVMNYAYPPETPGDIVVKAMYNRQFVKFVIIDSGRAFDPTEAVKADTTLSAEDRPIGGLGIFLVRELMDSINYERVDGHNILTLRKDLKHET